MAGPNLNAKISADARQYNKTMQKVKGRAKGLSSSFKALAGTMAAYFGIRAITRFIGKLDEIGKHAKRLQITTDEFQRFSFAAERSGASIENVEAAMKKMNKMINDAKRGLSTAKMAFNELGLSVEDFNGLSEADKFKLISRALNLMSDAGRKAALSQEFMSRSGMALIPMMEDLDKLFTEAEKHGIIDEGSIKAAEELADQMTNLNRSVTAFVTDSGIIKFLNDVTKKLDSTSSAAKGLFEQFVEAGNITEKLKLEGAVGPGLDKSLGTTFLDMLLARKNEGFVIPAPTPGDIARAGGENEQKILEVEKKISEEKEKQKKTDEEIKAIQDSSISNIEKKRIEAEQKRLQLLEHELSLLKAQSNLSAEDFKRKKLELETEKKLKAAKTERERDIIREQAKEKEKILEKDIAKSEQVKSATMQETSDRLRRIGVTVGGAPKGEVQNKERNSLLKKIDRTLKDIKEINQEQDDVARAG